MSAPFLLMKSRDNHPLHRRLTRWREHRTVFSPQWVASGSKGQG
jgi:hypothetical protein